MQVLTRNHSAGFPIYSVSSQAGEFELSTFGAQILSWSKNGTEIMFSNREHAVHDGKAAYRGGAPICFPYFSKGALLPSKELLAPQHGPARTSVWESVVNEAEATITLKTEQPTPEGFGPTNISCELVYTFTDSLKVEAYVVNVGQNSSPFQLAIHTYWACQNPSAATILGLNKRYLDNLASLAETQDPAPNEPHLPPFDRIYLNSESNLELATDHYKVDISTQNCLGSVLWNPGPNHPITDLGSPDFVCVESGAITPPPVLHPGQDYRLEVAYHAELLS